MHREDMVAKLSSVSGFVGRLVKIQYASGQPCAQLLFQTAHGPRLSLNRDIHVLQALAVGETYRVEGARREVSGKLYWHEPAIRPIPQKSRFTSRARLAGIALVLGLAITAALLVRGQRQDHFATAESVSGRTTTTQAPSKSVVPDNATTTSPAASAHTPSAAPATQKTSQTAVRKNTAATGQSSATNPAAAAASTTTTPPD